MTRLLDRILNRRRSYRLLFLDAENKPNRAAEAVLADLRRFCLAQSSTAAVNPLTRSVDPLAMAMAEGRREVWNRIQAHLNLSDRDITHLQEEPCAFPTPIPFPYDHSRRNRLHRFPHQHRSGAGRPVVGGRH